MGEACGKKGVWAYIEGDESKQKVWAFIESDDVFLNFSQQKVTNCTT
jgi:hypothetical protein